MYLKNLILTVLSASVASGVVVTSNRYFDRIETPNWETEVTFYGLGLNFSWPMNFTQKMTQTFAECKIVFRVVPACISAFAQKQSNGSVLCTYFQEPIYALPTVSADKSISLAFYKDIPVVSNMLMTNALLANGKFYLYIGTQTMSKVNRTCRDKFPNGIQIRPKSNEDFNFFFNNPRLKLANEYAYLGLDLQLINGTGSDLIWGDGTPYLKTEAALMFKLASLIGPCFSVYVDKHQYIHSVWAETLVYATCEVNPFAG